MNTIYRLNVNELDEKFIQSLKALFRDKDIEIIVRQVLTGSGRTKSLQ